MRAKILLHYARGLTISAMVKTLHVSRPTIYKCIDRALAGGIMVGLEDHPHCPHEPEISDQAREWILSLAMSQPQALGLPFHRWSLTRLAGHVREHALRAGFPRLASASKTTIWRILRRQAHPPAGLKHLIRPRNSRDPRQKTHRVLLLSHVFRLRSAADPSLPGAPVFSLDMSAGSPIQILGTVNHNPGQYGTGCGPASGIPAPKTLYLLAGLDLDSGEIIALVVTLYRIREFLLLLQRLDAHYPDQAVIRLVLSTRSAHVAPETMDYLAKHPGRFEYIHKPRHGSWLNLAESLFARMIIPALTGIRGDTPAVIKEKILGMIDAMNRQPMIARWEESVFYLAGYMNGTEKQGRT